MEIKREKIISALTTDGRVMKSGQEYVFNTTSGCFVGEFFGISKRGTLQFKGIICEETVWFNVLPKSICEIYEVYARKITGSEDSKCS